MNAQIKHRKRVTDHGEVFTHEREVNSMLDLVKQETERLDSRFLEPACGDGNFLSEVLNRKLKILKQRYSKSQYDYERYSVVVISSIYGIDILKDNVEECRERLLNIFIEQYRRIFKNNINERFLEILKIILEKNIVQGDALTMKDKKGNPLVFSEWSMPYNDARLKQKEYSFKDIFTPSVNWTLDRIYTTDKETGERAILPNVLKDYPLINYMELTK
tara:strand:+ start:151 stop:804 length:654 start_codon:yes stop_codon:yes gene_type:complete